MKLIEDLKWRYATKKFNKNKPVTEQVVYEILAAGNLSATSFGMQAYKFILVKDKKIIEKLAEHSWGEQLSGSSFVIILAANTQVDDDFIKDYLAYSSKIEPRDEDKIEARYQMMKGFIKRMEDDGIKDSWAARQVYIVLGTLMAACANAKVDSCPMEGIDKVKYDEILGLRDKNLTTIVSLPIGYRADDDEYQYKNKIRRPLEDMVIEY